MCKYFNRLFVFRIRYFLNVASSVFERKLLQKAALPPPLEEKGLINEVDNKTMVLQLVYSDLLSNNQNIPLKGDHLCRDFKGLNSGKKLHF